MLTPRCAVCVRHGLIIRRRGLPQTAGGAEMQTEPINQLNVIALVEMETWALVAELAKPLVGYHAIPPLIALRIVISHLIRQMEDLRETLQMLIADLNAALEQKPMRAN